MAAIILGLGLLAAVGCAHQPPTTRPSDSRQRQDAALHDPFDYKPDMAETDISGGDLGHLDRGAMKRDMDHVLNP